MVAVKKIPHQRPTRSPPDTLQLFLSSLDLHELSEPQQDAFWRCVEQIDRHVGLPTDAITSEDVHAVRARRDEWLEAYRLYIHPEADAGLIRLACQLVIGFLPNGHALETHERPRNQVRERLGAIFLLMTRLFRRPLALAP